MKFAFLRGSRTPNLKYTFWGVWAKTPIFGGWAIIAYYAKNHDENEHIAIWEGPGLAEGVKLHTLLRSFELSAATTQCEKPLYHMQMRSAEGEHLTREQWLYSVQKAEDRLGLTGQERVIVAHTKEGQEHVHVVWNRIDYERGKAVELSFDARKRLDVARELENELGLRTLGNERGGKLSAKEEAFAQRHKKDPQEIKAILQTCWEHADTGKEFTAHLDAYGMTLAKGDKRGFLAVDREGDFYLVSRTTGSKEKEVREKFADLDRDQLPTLDQARTQQKERQSADLLQQQAIDRNRLEVKQWQDLQRVEDQLTHKAAMRDRVQQAHTEDHDARKQRRTARLGATLYDRADMVSMQRDAMRQLRDRIKVQERHDRQAHAQQRREAGQQRYQQTAYARTEARHAKQHEQLAVRQFLDRQRAGVADPERDRKVLQMLLPRQFDKAADQMTLTAAQKEQLRLWRERQKQEQLEREQQARVQQEQRERQRKTQEEGHTAETSTERTERLTREASGTGKVLTEREKRRQILDEGRQRLGIPNPGEGRERTRDR